MHCFSSYQMNKEFKMAEKEYDHELDEWVPVQKPKPKPKQEKK